jgi:hypothetical protein
MAIKVLRGAVDRDVVEWVWLYMYGGNTRGEMSTGNLWTRSRLVEEQKWLKNQQMAENVAENVADKQKDLRRGWRAPLKKLKSFGHRLRYLLAVLLVGREMFFPGKVQKPADAGREGLAGEIDMMCG